MLLEAKCVSKTFKSNGNEIQAVKNATLRAEPDSFVAIVGESGSGKSTLARLLLGLSSATSGTVELDGVSLNQMTRRKRMEFRRTVQAVLQDPAGSLNPRKTVGRAVDEVIRLHTVARGQRQVRGKTEEVLELVGLSPGSFYCGRFPHELSGGQRQRVLIARAIVLNPQLIVADEAVSALDASVKAGVLQVMAELRERLNVGYVFITHDLPVVKKVADYVYVMKSGEILEEGHKSSIFSDPQHPYTQELLASAPTLDATGPNHLIEPVELSD